MVLLDQLQTDQRKLDREIDKLKSKLGGSSSNRGGLQEAIKEQDSLRQSLKITRDHIEELQTKLHSFNEKFQSLQTNKNRQMEDISRVCIFFFYKWWFFFEEKADKLFFYLLTKPSLNRSH